MKIIEIKPTKKFGGTWCAEEAPGVAPCFAGSNGKQCALDYARNSRLAARQGRFVYDEAGQKVVAY